MLRLHAPTDPRWLQRALANMDEVLVDHAHCERKAAGTALNLLFRYPTQPALTMPLSELAREELEHFEQVVRLIRARGGEFRPLRASPYASELLSIVRRKEPLQLMDLLLCSAFIEARSCERMILLSDALTEPDLKQLYAGLLASEARHHALYVDLALQIFAEADVRARMAEVSVHEAQVIARAPEWPRVHT